MVGKGRIPVQGSIDLGLLLRCGSKTCTVPQRPVHPDSSPPHQPADASLPSPTLTSSRAVYLIRGRDSKFVIINADKSFFCTALQPLQTLDCKDATVFTSKGHPADFVGDI